MIYSKENKWYFIHVPKNAGSAILRKYVRLTKLVGGNAEFKWKDLQENKDELNLGVLEQNDHNNHNKASYWAWSEQTNGLHPLGILRNPWGRALSIYLFQLKITSKNLGEDWADIDHPILTRQGFKTSWMEGGFFVDGHARNIEFNEKTGRNWAFDDDQYSWLEGVEDAKWFRLEDQLDDFLQYTGLEKPKHYNVTSKTDYKKYYDDELIERIGTIYKRDVELGNYEF